MKLLKDIRYFESTQKNIVGYSPSYIGNVYCVDSKKLNVISNRLVLNLREKNFCLPDFDHLYLNFTSFVDYGNFRLAEKPIDKYHPFYRYVDFGLSSDEFSVLNEDDKISTIVRASAEVLSVLYDSNDVYNIMTHAEEILTDGQKAKMIVKQKCNQDLCVQIMTRILDNGLYVPSVKILNNNDVLINEFFYDRALHWEEFIFQFGSITIGKMSVTIKPKKNSLSHIYNFDLLKYKI